MIKRILFVLATLLLAGGGLYVRSLNATSANTQAQAIIKQDAAGADTAAAVAALRDYAKAHMGADASFTLAGAYARAQAAAKAAAAASAANSQIYADAQRACSGKSDSITQARCNQDYLAKHLANVPLPTPVPEPKPADYQYHITAPLWTPDLAGALLLGAAAALGLTLATLRRRRR
jgi:hypothetical protein